VVRIADDLSIIGLASSQGSGSCMRKGNVNRDSFGRGERLRIQFGKLWRRDFYADHHLPQSDFGCEYNCARPKDLGMAFMDLFYIGLSLHTIIVQLMVERLHAF
jgi:hypothetical protein